MKHPICVLIADDSPSVCRMLTSYLQASEDFHVVGKVFDGHSAVKQVEQLKPDVLLLDLDMPGMSGLGALEQIMTECPTPVVLVSGMNRNAAQASLKALELGAVDFIFKYTHGSENRPEVLRQEILSKVRAAAEVRVVRLLRSHAMFNHRKLDIDLAQQSSVNGSRDFSTEAISDPPESVVILGASTGGPISVRQFLCSLPDGIPATILIVQHFPPGFTKVLAAQLDRQVSIEVREAGDGDYLVAGQALVAPSNYHMLVGTDSRVILNQEPELNGHRPSITLTMQSVAERFGEKTHGVLLSGMGEDGPEGLSTIQARGGKTYAQEMSTCVASGMPRRAIDSGSVDFIGPPDVLAQQIAADYALTALEYVS